MAVFKQYPKGSLIGSESYGFRHYGTEGRLPSGYQEVEWIGSDGNQCIQVAFGSGRVGAYIEQQIMRTDSGVRGLIGAASQNATAITAGSGTYYGWNTSGYWEMGGSAVSSVLSSTSQFDSVVFTWYANHSGKLTVNGTELVSRAGTTSSSYFNIFGGSNYKASCKQKECKVHNSTSGTLTAHLIPCYRISDGVIGMYDIVGNTFYTNIGTGTFTKGDDV